MGVSAKPLKCRWPAHGDCPDPAVAWVGLPGKNALPVCLRGFNEFVAHQKEDK